MANAFRTDMGRACGSRGFATGILVFALAGFFGVVGEALPVLAGETTVQSGYWIRLAIEALQSDPVALAVPIIAALPFTAAFVDDASTRYLRSEIIRSGRLTFVVARTLVSAFAGALALLVGVELLCVLFALLLTPVETVPDVAKVEPIGGATDQLALETQLAFSDLMGRALLFSLSGAFWALIGSLVAAATMSRHMAWAAPFILYYALVILTQRYIKDVYVLDPQEWLNPSALWNTGTIWPAALFVGELIIIAGLAYAFLLRRRLEDV